LILDQNPPKSVDEESLFNLTNFFFSLAILMGVVAVYVSNMKPKMKNATITPPINPMEFQESMAEVKTLETASLQALQSVTSAEE
jgi:hypothetical protein